MSGDLLRTLSRSHAVHKIGRATERVNQLSRTLGRAHDVVPEDGLSGGSDKPSEAQLRLLKALGHTDTPPATKREASALIEALKEAQVNANGEAF